ncbi:MAG: Fe-S cluster assembly scaffold protein NifU [Firmicutes bacterium]|nr:Fe-S cluster assembly scaffold protein NifU [Bacillota bacterium]
MYTQTVMEHFMKPHNVGEIEEADGTGEVGNATCGDIMRITLKIKDDKIEDIKFKTFGCAAAIATSSMVTELAKGKTLDEASKITNKDVAEALEGLPPIKMHCSNLAATALKAAIKDYQIKNGTSPDLAKNNGEAVDLETDCSCESGPHHEV